MPMSDPELQRANAICVQNRITITLYTGTSNAMFASNLTQLHQFDTEQKFRDTYVTQKLGSNNQKFNANYGPGIYLTNNMAEAKTYGSTLIKFVCTNTPFVDVTGANAKKFRTAANIKGGPQVVLAESRLAALLLVAGGTTQYYTLRTPTGVTTEVVGQ